MLTGPTVRARLMRAFLPLTAGAILIQGLLHVVLPEFFNLGHALASALLAIFFLAVTFVVVVLTSGEIARALDHAEEALKSSIAQLQRALDGTVTALSTATETRDPYTANHHQRVAQLACAIAEELGFTKDRQEGLRVMAFLHDIGKMAVPAEILSKPGKLSEHERNIIRVHSQVSFEILKEIEFPWPVAQAALQHHERLDGSGYPHGIAGPDIIMEARILAVADVVEAMVSHRPYRPALTIDQVLKEIARKQGILYDPEVVEACLRLFGERGFQFR